MGAKDDSRDAEVIASSLGTDPHSYRLAEIDPLVIELHEWPRISENFVAEKTQPN